MDSTRSTRTHCIGGSQSVSNGKGYPLRVKKLRRRPPSSQLLSPEQARQAMLGQKPPTNRHDSLTNSSSSSDMAYRPSQQPTPQNQGKASRQVKTSAPPGGYLMHRAPGMFDLSNIKSGSACAEHRSSIYNIYEEFHRQFGLLQTSDSKQDRTLGRAAEVSNKG